ncbi:hypothetical protein ASE17_05010 [Phenylobacterium sp. Root77]|uniref:hypothetical protein n=1 Tax=unclassified Phenylobacterium TaxID=2640670 RepID=UPI0006FC081F|nr:MULTISPECIES: hypothetical protein [unclassified Phenylobacterium]KQW72229.1 hypothetical protein ASC73_09235 [Phenylobacterium sp. Root1277]KQW95149.1 hypothetical protein ASC79_05380 [Phenylobacterium sp. Root1290]KRC44842.1 hypothetical protein ASE17_05010 [Phenylobacterium sp. Root77]
MRDGQTHKTVNVQVLWDMAAIIRSICTLIMVALIVVVAALNDELVIGLTSAGAVIAGTSVAGVVRSVLHK